MTCQKIYRAIWIFLWMNAIICSLGILQAAENSEETVLIDDDFETIALRAEHSPWLVYDEDENNEVATLESPDGKSHAVRFTDIGGTGWKPLLSGKIKGESESYLQLDFDWYLPQAFDTDKKSLCVTVARDKGNVSAVEVHIGGPSGIAVRDKNKLIPLNVTIKTGQWNHMTIVCDPISRGAEGAFNIIVVQDKEKSVFENFPFSPNFNGEYVASLWYSPFFALGSGEAAGEGKEAWIDNVKLKVVKDRSIP